MHHWRIRITETVACLGLVTLPLTIGCHVDADLPMASEEGGDESSMGDGSSIDELGTPTPTAEGPCVGYATRYWDCCKPHCSWEGNVPPSVDPLGTCNQADVPQGDPNLVSSCNQPGTNSAHTCYSLAPWAVNNQLSYGFAAVPAAGDVCGRCYSLEFTGASHNAGADPGSSALSGKTMIVQAINIGYDVGGGQFDLLIPGGGVGLFDACSTQWGANPGELGATYGGLLTACKQQVGGAGHEAIKSCVVDRCNDLFAGGQYSDLAAGCDWFINWFEAADNPALTYSEVACPAELMGATGMDRSGLGDTLACGGGGGDGGDGGGDGGGGGGGDCDCGWTNGGANCGSNDGSYCWGECCGGGGGDGGGDGDGGGVSCPGGCDCSWTNGGANCGWSDGSCCWTACCG